MAECMLMKNGSGIKSDDLTVNASKVISGYTYVGSDTDDDIGTGTLNSRLTANASMVLSGYTYVGSDSGSDIRVGTLAPQLVGTYSDNQTINVSAWKRATDTVNNFIVEVVSIGSKNNSTGHHAISNVVQNGTTMSKNLNGNYLYVSGASVSCRAYWQGDGYQDTIGTASASITYKVWHI